MQAECDGLVTLCYLQVRDELGYLLGLTVCAPLLILLFSLCRYFLSSSVWHTRIYVSCSILSLVHMISQGVLCAFFYWFCFGMYIATQTILHFRRCNLASNYLMESVSKNFGTLCVKFVLTVNY